MKKYQFIAWNFPHVKIVVSFETCKKKKLIKLSMFFSKISNDKKLWYIYRRSDLAHLNLWILVEFKYLRWRKRRCFFFLREKTTMFQYTINKQERNQEKRVIHKILIRRNSNINFFINYLSKRHRPPHVNRNIGVLSISFYKFDLNLQDVFRRARSDLAVDDIFEKSISSSSIIVCIFKSLVPFEKAWKFSL